MGCAASVDGQVVPSQQSERVPKTLAPKEKATKKVLSTINYCVPMIRQRNWAGTVTVAVSMLGVSASISTSIAVDHTNAENQATPSLASEAAVISAGLDTVTETQEELEQDRSMKDKVKEKLQVTLDNLCHLGQSMHDGGVTGFLGAAISVEVAGTGISISLDVSLPALIQALRGSDIGHPSEAAVRNNQKLVKGIQDAAACLLIRGWAGTISATLSLAVMSLTVGIVITPVDAPLEELGEDDGLLDDDEEETEVKSIDEKESDKWHKRLANRALNKAMGLGLAMTKRNMTGEVSVGFSLKIADVGFSLNFAITLVSILPDISAAEVAEKNPAESTKMNPMKKKMLQLKAKADSVAGQKAQQVYTDMIDDLQKCQDAMKSFHFAGSTGASFSVLGLSLGLTIYHSPSHFDPNGNALAKANPVMVRSLELARQFLDVCTKLGLSVMVGAGFSFQIVGTGVSFDVMCDGTASVESFYAHRTASLKND